MKDIYLLIESIGRGGAEKIAVMLANELAEQGHNVHLLTLRKDVGYQVSERVELLAMSEARSARGYWNSLVEMLRGLRWVRRILNEHGHSAGTVVVSHLTRCNFINIALDLLLPQHRAICVSHNSVGFYKDRGFLKRSLLVAQGLFFPLAFRTVCVSRRMAADYRRLWLFRKFSIVTIYNPVSLPSSDQTSPPREALSTPQVHIAMVGRLHAVKRHDIALRAIAALKARSGRTFVLHIVGDGPEENRVRDLIEELGIAAQVVMHGWLEDTSNVVGNCAFSVLCSDTEGLPNSILESLALGVPVVATDCVSGPRELLAPDEDLEGDISFENGYHPAAHGVLVRLGDPIALANAIEYQAGVKDQARSFECIAFARQFDTTIIAGQYADLISTCELSK